MMCYANAKLHAILTHFNDHDGHLGEIISKITSWMTQLGCEKQLLTEKILKGLLGWNLSSLFKGLIHRSPLVNISVRFCLLICFSRNDVSCDVIRFAELPQNRNSVYIWGQLSIHLDRLSMSLFDELDGPRLKPMKIFQLWSV